MRLRKDTLEALRIHGIRPRINLGQSFVVDEELIERMMNYAKVCDKDKVLDIGAGLGFLTEALAKKAERVFAIEIDPRLLKILRERLASYKNVSIIEGDLRKVRLPPIDKVVSNPPYSISSDLFLRRLLDYRLCVLTLQREFVEKLMAEPGRPNYGRVSVMARLLWKIERLETLPRGVFQPIPKVQSCLVRLTRAQGSETLLPIVEDSSFLDLLSFLFSERRRNLSKVLRKYLELRRLPEKVEGIGLDRHILSLRVCDLEPKDFVTLAKELIALKNRK
ncbi:MAG: 16S rRNA (adenine(1518)-N(6)/adenine(1519)-N(6))-dimethyltransferase RsmA [Candidatus Bathyarchaeia archaeon]